jgi:hypothetical protein
MSKIILIMSIGCLSFLLFMGIFSPENPTVWMASTSSEFAALRFGLILVLLGLLVTKPPRNIYFRYFVAFISIGLMSWAMGATYTNNMKFLDTLILLEVAIASGIISLEYAGHQDRLELSTT